MQFTKIAYFALFGLAVCKPASQKRDLVPAAVTDAASTAQAAINSLSADVGSGIGGGLAATLGLASSITMAGGLVVSVAGSVAAAGNLTLPAAANTVVLVTSLVNNLIDAINGITAQANNLTSGLTGGAAASLLTTTLIATRVILDAALNLIQSSVGNLNIIAISTLKNNLDAAIVAAVNALSGAVS